MYAQCMPESIAQTTRSQLQKFLDSNVLPSLIFLSNDTTLSIANGHDATVEDDDIFGKDWELVMVPCVDGTGYDSMVARGKCGFLDDIFNPFLYRKIVSWEQGIYAIVVKITTHKTTPSGRQYTLYHHYELGRGNLKDIPKLYFEIVDDIISQNGKAVGYSTKHRDKFATRNLVIIA